MLDKTEETITNWQSRETGKNGNNTQNEDRKKKQKHQQKDEQHESSHTNWSGPRCSPRVWSSCFSSDIHHVTHIVTSHKKLVGDRW